MKLTTTHFVTTKDPLDGNRYYVPMTEISREEKKERLKVNQNVKHNKDNRKRYTLRDNKWRRWFGNIFIDRLTPIRRNHMKVQAYRRRGCRVASTRGQTDGTGQCRRIWIIRFRCQDMISEITYQNVRPDVYMCVSKCRMTGSKVSSENRLWPRIELVMS